MQACRPDLSRRTFNALAVTALAAGSHAEGMEDRRAQFARDVARCYERQYVAFDLEDVNSVFRRVRTPALGVGVAGGDDRAASACQAAVRDAGGVGGHTLVIVAFPPRDWRLREYTAALKTVRAELDPRATVIFGLCEDERLAKGTARVSVLAG